MILSHFSLIRRAIIFWIFAPILLSIVLIGFVEITGRFFQDNIALAGNAWGVIFLSAIIPILAAHIAFVAAVLGLIGLFFGCPRDRNLIISIIIGFLFGFIMLYKIYWR